MRREAIPRNALWMRATQTAAFALLTVLGPGCATVSRSKGQSGTSATPESATSASSPGVPGAEQRIAGSAPPAGAGSPALPPLPPGFESPAVEKAILTIMQASNSDALAPAAKGTSTVVSQPTTEAGGKGQGQKLAADAFPDAPPLDPPILAGSGPQPEPDPAPSSREPGAPAKPTEAQPGPPNAELANTLDANTLRAAVGPGSSASDALKEPAPVKDSRVAQASAAPPSSAVKDPQPQALATRLLEEPSQVDESVQQAECVSCGGSGKLAGVGTCTTCRGSGLCVPGQPPCYPFPDDNFLARFFGELYYGLFCPDHCYEPTWVPEANSAFFQDYARPQTLTRFGWNHGVDMQFPDRSEMFWPRAGLNRKNTFVGTGPKPPNVKLKNGQPVRGFFGVSWDDLTLYQEASTGKFSLFVEQTYRSVGTNFGQHWAGFGDLNTGTKTLLVDTELLQGTFQFKTFVPIGNPSKGLGTGHVSLEPSLLTSIHLAPETYAQGQLAEWIPVGGANGGWAGSVLHYHLSMNQVLCRFTPDVPLIGMLEFNGWSFQAGGYTNPITGPQLSSGTTYLSLGPSFRISIRKMVDFGTGFSYPISDFHWANPLIRTEFRIIF